MIELKALTRVALLAGLATCFVASSASAESLLMSGKYTSDYGSINIPVIDNVVGSDFVEVTGTGTKKTVIVPTGFMKGGAGLIGKFVIPIPGNAAVQQLATTFVMSVPPPNTAPATMAPGLTANRPQTNFAWCPGMTVATCMDHRASATGAPPGSGVSHGLIRYTNDGPVYSGSMRLLIGGSGALSNKIGLTPRFQHTPLGGGGGTIPRAMGGSYANSTNAAGASAVITTGAVLSGMTASGGIIVVPGNFISSVPPTLNQKGWGMPMTIGNVYVKHTAGNGTVTTQSGTGAHTTIKGRGNILMVGGGIASPVEGSGVGGFPALITLRMSIAEGQLTPALSPLGMVTMAGLLLTAGGYMLRRSFR